MSLRFALPIIAALSLSATLATGPEALAQTEPGAEKPAGHRHVHASVSGLGFLPVLNLFGPNFKLVAGKTHYLRVRYNGNYFEQIEVSRGGAMSDIKNIKALNK